MAVYRVYFNTHGDVSKVTSVDGGSIDTELSFPDVELLGVDGHFVYAGKRPWPEPSFWLEVVGEFHYQNGKAFICGSEE